MVALTVQSLIQQYTIIVLLSLICGVVIGYFSRKAIEKKLMLAAEQESKRLIDDAKLKAETLKKEALISAREEVERDRREFDRESKYRKVELQKIERRLQSKEENIDRKMESIERKERDMGFKEKKIEAAEKEAERIIELQKKKLEEVSGLSSEEAKKVLFEEIKDQAKLEAAQTIRRIEEEAKKIADKKAKDIIVNSIQRCAAETVTESTVSTVALPNDDMKGRIIGREGRNIRTLEAATGIDLIIDDTPEAVILSGYDPVRRQIAKISLEKLIADGRIHPGRIEEVVEKAREEVERLIVEEGERTMFDLGIRGIAPELVKVMGRLKYRTSYGQNVLQHSKEVAYLASAMAAELGADVALAKRASLLHDIGKAIDHEVEGSHAVIGGEIAKKYNEHPDIVNAIASHHNDEPPRTIEAVLVQAADAISAARPGARKENVDIYLKRLEKLEKIATSFNGVSKTYAIQAGREIRIIVENEKVSDDAALILARDIAKKVEEELEYPGQIKITVIRETRVVEFAK